MPEIPQFRASEPIASLPEPVMDRAQRPRLDINGAINAVGRLADSMRGTEVSQYLSQVGAEAFGGQSAKALGAVAEGVADVGRVFADLHERRIEAQNEYDYEQGKSIRDLGKADYDRWRMEKAPNNPELWEAEWEQRKVRIESQLQERGYSRHVQDKLSATGERWQAETTINVSTEAMKQTFARTRQTLVAKSDALFAAGEVEQGEMAIANMVASGHMTPYQAAQQNLRGREKAYAAKRQNWVSMDPGKVMEWVENPEAKDAPTEFSSLMHAGAERKRLFMMAGAEVERQKSTVINSISTAIGSGEVADARSLDLMLQSVEFAQRISDEDRKFYIGSLNGEPLEGAMLDKVEQSLKAYDPAAKDAEMRGVEIENYISMLGADASGRDHAKTFKERLQLKQKGHEDRLSEHFKQVDTEIENRLLKGDYGVWEIPSGMIEWSDAAKSWTRSLFDWEPKEMGDKDGRVRIEVSQSDARRLTQTNLSGLELMRDIRGETQAKKKASDLKLSIQQNRAEGKYQEDPNLAYGDVDTFGGGDARRARSRALGQGAPVAGVPLRDISAPGPSQAGFKGPYIHKPFMRH